MVENKRRNKRDVSHLEEDRGAAAKVQGSNDVPGPQLAPRPRRQRLFRRRRVHVPVKVEEGVVLRVLDQLLGEEDLAAGEATGRVVDQSYNSVSSRGQFPTLEELSVSRPAPHSLVFVVEQPHALGGACVALDRAPAVLEASPRPGGRVSAVQSRVDRVGLVGTAEASDEDETLGRSGGTDGQ